MGSCLYTVPWGLEKRRGGRVGGSKWVSTYGIGNHMWPTTWVQIHRITKVSFPAPYCPNTNMSMCMDWWKTEKHKGKILSLPTNMELARRSLGATLLLPPFPHHHIFIKIPLFKPKEESVILGVYNTSKIL